MSIIKDLREEKNINMKEAAKLMDLPYTTYVGYEKGDREPNSEMWIRIASFFDVPIDFLVGAQPFSYWDDINHDRFSFFKSVDLGPNKKDILKLIYGIDIDAPYSASIHTVVSFISIYAKSIERDSEGFRIIPKEVASKEKDNRAFVTMPTIAEDTVTFPVIGEMAAGYDSIALEDWRGETVEIPMSYLKGHAKDEYIVLSVKGDSMYPVYHQGDRVLVLRQEDVPFSGAVGAVRYSDELVTLKIVEKRTDTSGDAYIRLKPINPQYPPLEIRGEDLDHYAIIGIPKLLIRDIEE